MRLIVFASFFLLLLPAFAAQEDEPAFPSFDYEVICYANNIFTRGGGPLGDISSCKKDEETARDRVYAVWAKLLPTGRTGCIEYAKRYARGSYERLQECVSIGLLLSLKEGLLVRAPPAPKPPSK